MENKDYFVLVKVCVLNDGVDISNVKDVMEETMTSAEQEHLHEPEEMDELLEFNRKIEYVKSMYSWVEAPVVAIDTLPIGTVFKGVTKNSLIGDYIVVAKDENGKSLWLPLYENTEILVVASMYNTETGLFETLFTGTESEACRNIFNWADNGKFFRFTLVDGTPVNIFDDDEEAGNGIFYCAEVESDDDDDDEPEYEFKSMLEIVSCMKLAKEFKPAYDNMIEGMKRVAANKDKEESCECEHHTHQEEIPEETEAPKESNWSF